MDIQGEKILATPRAEVWRALNDPAILRRCIPGCDTFEAEGENRYRVAMQAAVGPVRARFAGKLQLRDVIAPTSYALAFEGSGGVAGFGKGTAQVELADAPGGTLLRYRAEALGTAPERPPVPQPTAAGAATGPSTDRTSQPVPPTMPTAPAGTDRMAVLAAALSATAAAVAVLAASVTILVMR